MYNKKAQSEIITTVLIILLVLAAIVIVWQVVRSTVTTGANQITGGTDCITLGFEITKAASGANNITVKRIAGAGDLASLKLIVNGIINSTTATTMNELESTTLLLSGTAPTLKTGDKVEVAAVLGTISNSKVCNVAASKTI
jgi:flagellin-like protein